MPAPRTMTVSVLAIAVAAIASCDAAATCEEDIRAQTDLPTLTLEIDGATVEVEVADDEIERGRGWMHRQCGREGILMVPDAGPELMSIWGCGLTDPVSLHFIRDGVVVEYEARLEPCDEPCSACPTATSDEPVDAVLESLEGRFDARIGDPVGGLPSPG